ncbi:hypothetical protein CLF_103898 [Clonorchis sinensis]|uniref:Uncharacterized protein n=1 Tax=Clonorchis sinensis TaxID=79923 RepID=G7YAK7_CLOSI|nr:hypothetical protein CLF_103898 [Clonorchis sinensis]
MTSCDGTNFANANVKGSDTVSLWLLPSNQLVKETSSVRSLLDWRRNVYKPISKLDEQINGHLTCIRRHSSGRRSPRVRFSFGFYYANNNRSYQIPTDHGGGSLQDLSVLVQISNYGNSSDSVGVNHTVDQALMAKRTLQLMVKTDGKDDALEYLPVDLPELMEHIIRYIDPISERCEQVASAFNDHRFTMQNSGQSISKKTGSPYSCFVLIESHQQCPSCESPRGFEPMTSRQAFGEQTVQSRAADQQLRQTNSSPVSQKVIVVTYDDWVDGLSVPLERMSSLGDPHNWTAKKRVVTTLFGECSLHPNVTTADLCSSDAVASTTHRKYMCMGVCVDIRAMTDRNCTRIVLSGDI